MINKFARSVSLIVTLVLVFSPQMLLATPQYFIQNSLTSSHAQSTRLEISLSRRRVTLYRGTTRIKSYPVAIGRPGWETPTGNFRVIQMKKNPIWIHPWTGKAISGGHPRNPLGRYWIGFWTDGTNYIGLHGTPNPETIGRAVSHGCVRMHNRDIEQLFSQVDAETIITVTP
jgi:lipoprotein-anchoring transpeptidase ErfK/SrfK